MFPLLAMAATVLRLGFIRLDRASVPGWESVVLLQPVKSSTCAEHQQYGFLFNLLEGSRKMFFQVGDSPSPTHGRFRGSRFVSGTGVGGSESKGVSGGWNGDRSNPMINTPFG